MQFYLKATACCDECHWTGDFLVNKDLEVWHECNQGNVKFVPPELEIRIPKNPTQHVTLEVVK